MTEHEQAIVAHMRTAARAAARNDKIGLEAHVLMAMEAAAKSIAGEAPYDRKPRRFLCLETLGLRHVLARSHA